MTKAKVVYYCVTAGLVAIFTGNILIGVLNGVHGLYPSAQAGLIISGNFAGLVAIAVPFLLKKFGVNVSKSIIYFWWAFAFANGALGETLVLYYRSKAFDKILHGVAGFLVFFTAFGLARSFFAYKRVPHKFFICCIFAVCAAITVAVAWELCEFTCDSVFGTNAQKFIPLNDLFNGGYSFEDLNGTDAEIAEFYRSPSGYKFALMDTMLDLVVYLAGTAIAVISAVLVNLKYPYSFENSFEFKKARRKS